MFTTVATPGVTARNREITREVNVVAISVRGIHTQ